MLKIVAQWIWIRTWIIFYNITTECNSTFIFLALFLQLAFCSWRMSINDANWTVAPDVLASSNTCFLLWTFIRFHAEIFSSFQILCPVLPLTGIFMACGKRINLWTKLQCCNELSPFTAIWSSWWVGNDSPIRSLVHSKASKIHANFVLNPLNAPLPNSS